MALGLVLLSSSPSASVAAELEAWPGLADVGGYRLFLDCRGSADPSVVIDGGAGTWSIFYRHLQIALAAEARVCVYDRAGLGRSDLGPLPRTHCRRKPLPLLGVPRLHEHQTGHLAGVAPLVDPHRVATE
jgi:hypothetical protein